MALYRFLFAPVLLAVAVLTTSPRRVAAPVTAPTGGVAAQRIAAMPASHVPGGAARVASSHPATVR